MLRYHELTAALAQHIPEVRIPVEAERRWWNGETPGQHVVLGNVLAPFLAAELKRGDRPEVLARVRAFLEEMARSDDEAVREVLQQSVLAGLCDDQELSEKLKSLLGPESSRLMSDYCDAYHRH